MSATNFIRFAYTIHLFDSTPNSIIEVADKLLSVCLDKLKFNTIQVIAQSVSINITAIDSCLLEFRPNTVIPKAYTLIFWLTLNDFVYKQAFSCCKCVSTPYTCTKGKMYEILKASKSTCFSTNFYDKQFRQ